MSIKRFFYTRDFKKEVYRFSPKQKKKISYRVDLFLKDPFIPLLKTHKLKGKLKNYWSFSVSANLRIMFRFADKESVEFIDLGTHEIYK